MDVFSHCRFLPIPPLYHEQLFDRPFIERVPNDTGGVSRHDGIRRHILDNGGACADSATIPDSDVISSDHIPFRPRMAFDRLRLLPEKRKRIGTDPFGAVFTSKEDDTIGRNGKVFTDLQRGPFPPRHHPRFSSIAL